jgi:DNA-binding NarL/FixJ family response regulator
MTIRVVLAEDQPMVRAGFRALIDAQPDIVVVAEASTGDEALSRVRQELPDVVVMDIRMPDKDGLQATREITADPALGASRVLVLTTFELDEYVFAAIEAGASGFLLKGGEPADLLHAIRVLAAGDALLAPSITRRLIDRYLNKETRSTQTEPDGYGELTAREREMLTVIATGMTNAEIAAAFHLSPLTVKAHVSRILAKLGARDRVQLVVIAYRSGLVER